MAKKARVDVAVHFDRGRTFEKCIEAMKLGFTSVNYDCSELSMEENAEKMALREAAQVICDEVYRILR